MTFSASAPVCVFRTAARQRARSALARARVSLRGHRTPCRQLVSSRPLLDPLLDHYEQIFKYQQQTNKKQVHHHHQYHHHSKQQHGKHQLVLEI